MEEVKKGVLDLTQQAKKGKISLWLEDYNDIFSDFDSRAYAERALSEDFLAESRRAALSRGENASELNLLVPNTKRNKGIESIIRKRLKEHFKKHHELEHKKVRGILKMGLSFVLMGLVFMFTGAYLSAHFIKESFFWNLVFIILEPAGWFSFWEGLNLCIFERREKSIGLQFYEKIANIDIKFDSY